MVLIPERRETDARAAAERADLRDRFAIAAMTQCFALNRDYLVKMQDTSYPFEDAVARDAYRVADAMLAERDRTTQ